MKLIILSILLITGCSSVQQTLETDVFYRRDIGVEVNGQYFEGVTVVPYAKSYLINLIPPGKITLMLIRTCHREFSPKLSEKGWGLFKNKKQSYAYEYVPVQGIEDVRVCPLRVEVYESDKGRHSWAMIEMENPAYSLRFTVDCNGETHHANGVAACQAKEKSIQRLRFSEPVRFAPATPGCSEPVYRGGAYEIQATAGECSYVFDTQDKKVGRLTLVGWQGVLVREIE